MCGGAALWAGCRNRAGEPAVDREQVVVAPTTIDDAKRATVDDRALDEVLEMLHAQEPKSKQGLSTHAPMVAETLCTLGFADRAKAWVERYDAPLIDIPLPGRRIDRDRWGDALGPSTRGASWEAELARFGDWRVFFDEELRGARWQAVLDVWVARLAPGLAAAATHGVIRTAHAVRALSRSETPPRRAELARGLAYWAAAYEELPASVGTASTTDFAAALVQLPLYSKQVGGAPRGNIVSGLREVGKLAGFASARDLIATPADLDAGLSALSSLFARVYLQHGTRGHAVAFVHAITGPCALRRIAPHVSSGTARLALPYAWQAAAAIYTAYARQDHPPVAAEPKLAPKELAARAIENGNDHAIKVTETLLAEHRLRPDPEYLAAAEDAVARL